MNFIIDNIEYMIDFKHINTLNQKSTTCRLYKICQATDLDAIKIGNKYYKLYREGFANCHPKDNFQKKIGRKIALTRTIFDFDEKFRKNIWENYLKKTNPIKNEKINDFIEALKFYADIDNYFAIGIFPDQPCGNFANDIDETGKPGALARKILKKWKILSTLL